MHTLIHCIPSLIFQVHNAHIQFVCISLFFTGTVGTPEHRLARLEEFSGPLGLPQEVPLLNALDCWMSYCIMILVAGSALYLEPINKVGRDGWYGGMRRVEQ